MSARQSALIWGILLGFLLMYLYRKHAANRGR